MVGEVECFDRELKPYALVEERELAGEASIGVVDTGTLVAVAGCDGVRNAVAGAGGDLGAGDATVAREAGGDGAVDEAGNWEARLRGDGAGDLKPVYCVGSVLVGDGQLGDAEQGADETAALVDVGSGRTLHRGRNGGRWQRG